MTFKTQLKLSLGLGVLDWVYFASNNESVWLDLGNNIHWAFALFLWPLAINTFLVAPISLLMIIYYGFQKSGEIDSGNDKSS